VYHVGGGQFLYRLHRFIKYSPFTYIPEKKQQYIDKLKKLLKKPKHQTTYTHVKALLRKAIAGYSPVPTALQKENTTKPVLTDLRKEDTPSLFANTSVAMSHPEAVYVDTTLAAPVTAAGGNNTQVRHKRPATQAKHIAGKKPRRQKQKFHLPGNGTTEHRRTEDGLVVLDEQEAWFKLVRANAGVLKVAPDNVRENVPVVNEAVTYNGDALGYVPESFIEYYPTVMLAVRNRWSALQFAGPGLRAHGGFMTWAVNQNGLALQYGNDGIKRNHDVVLAAVTNNGLALQYAYKGLVMLNEDIVMAAVTNNGLAIQYVVEAFVPLTGTIVSAAVNSNPNALRFVDAQVALEYVKQDYRNLRYMDENRMNSKEFMFQAAGINIAVVDYMDPDHFTRMYYDRKPDFDKDDYFEENPGSQELYDAYVQWEQMELEKTGNYPQVPKEGLPYKTRA